MMYLSVSLIILISFIPNEEIEPIEAYGLMTVSPLERVIVSFKITPKIIKGRPYSLLGLLYELYLLRLFLHRWRLCF